MPTLQAWLATLIGRTALVEGKRLMIIELLQPGDWLVLQDTAAELAAFQENRFGQTTRRSRQTWNIHYLNEAGSAPHPVMLAYLSVAEAQQLMQLHSACQ